MKKNFQSQLWVGVADKNNDPNIIEQADKEYVGLPVEKALTDEKIGSEISTNRRDFLKYLGFGLGAATVAASCDTPVRKAIPYVTKPDAIVPGVATYYASSFVSNGEFCPVIVKTREGRPIKVEGNSLSKMTEGGTNARAQAMVLGLYDINRTKQSGKVVDGSIDGSGWGTISKEIKSKLSSDSKVRIVTQTELSPSVLASYEAFKATYPNTEVVTYDSLSSAALLSVVKEATGKAVVPDYDFGAAKTIVSFNADFLGTWISPVEYTNHYIKNRKIKDYKNPKQSRHIQVESRMSLTGSNADNRIQLRPSQQSAAIATLYNLVAAATGGQRVKAPKLDDVKASNAIKKTAKELIAGGKSGLVVCGNNNYGDQALCLEINKLIGSIGNTVKFGNVSMQKQGSDIAFKKLIDEMKSGSVDVLFVAGGNPAYDNAFAPMFTQALEKVKTKVAITEEFNETAAACDYVIAKDHGLESWSDAMPKAGCYALIQPTISRLFDTQSPITAMLTLANYPGLTGDRPEMDFIKSQWKETFAGQSNFLSFNNFWDSALHDGIIENEIAEGEEFSITTNITKAASSLTKPLSAAVEVELVESINIGSGQYANNPWLQEMPDPINRTVWGNYFSIPIKWNGSDFEGFNGVGKRLSYGETETFDVTVKGLKQHVTGVAQFGQYEGTASYALGFGREVVGRCGKEIGLNAYPWLSVDNNGFVQYFTAADEVSSNITTMKGFPCVQYHSTLGVTGKVTGSEDTVNVDEEAIVTLGSGYQGSLTNRTILYTGQSSQEGMHDLVDHIKEKRSEAKHLNDATLYPFEERMEDFYGVGHHWAMHVDMTACTGCGSCTVACMAENNIPVVGSKEVARHHEMTWLRIDRYFYGDVDNPSVAYQPLMCQHCDNAPCENVCPVNATNHSGEGLNQMAYNRCVGTRYCANNCPYKVRRFNWLDYTTADLFGANQNSINGEDPAYYTDNLTRMVLNPDVTVRSRGVIEKCSFCTQRLQEGKLNAKMEGRPLRDSDVKTACQTACPTGAITFGDRNNKKGEVSKKISSPVTYRVLEEVNVQSSVFYDARINNKKEDFEA